MEDYCTKSIKKHAPFTSVLVTVFAALLMFSPTSLSASTHSPGSDSLKIRLGFDQSEVNTWIEQHQDVVNEFMERLEEAFAAGQLEMVEINAYSCLIGTYEASFNTARRRAENFAFYLLDNSDLSSDKVSIKECDIAWSVLAEFVESDPNVPGREEVLRILQETPLLIRDDAGTIVDGRKKQLMEVARGDAYRYMRDHFFPEMRFVSASMLLIAPPVEEEVVPEETEVTPVVPVQAVDSVSVEEEVPPQTVVAEDSTATEEPVAQDTVVVSQEPVAESEYDVTKLRIKTNIPYWALVVPNLGVEVRLADHWSLDIPVLYSPFTVAKAYRFRVLAVQPSVRYWLKPQMKGHFFGIHLTGGQFNISVNDRQRFQDTDGAWGAGIDYGYSLDFNRHWGMEFNIGVGYIWSRYDIFYNIDNGARYDTSTLNYFGITRLGISIFYQF